MKKFLIASGVATLAFAAVAMAQGYSFHTNLTVGSAGPDVVSLQNYLIGAGYSIPAITSGAASKGYFGSQTKAAVAAFQVKNGIVNPGTGFFGPLTQAVINGGASTAMATGCPAGYTCTLTAPANTPFVCPAGLSCTPIGAGATVTGGTVGINTPGVQGLMSVTTGPLSSSVLNVGQLMAPIFTIRVQAQYSDLDVQNVTLDLGNNTGIYNKIFNKVYVMNGNTVLTSEPLNSQSVVQSGNNYIVGLGGFHFIVPKGTYQDLTIAADLNSSIDSTYLATGSHYPDGTHATINSIGGNNVTGWGIGLDQNSLRAVDGAGLNLYNTSALTAQTLVINSSLVDNAQANISIDGSSPSTNVIPVSNTSTGNISKVPVLVFDVNAQSDTLHLHTVAVNINSAMGVTTTGTSSAAYLMNGSTIVSSASISNGVATFSNITDGTLGASIPVNSTVAYTVALDVSGVTAGTLNISAVLNSGSVTIYNSQDSTVSVVGSASGNTITIAGNGPVFTLSGAPTIAISGSNQTGTTLSTSTISAVFSLNIGAIGTNVVFGETGSSSPAFLFNVIDNNGSTIYSGYGQGTSAGVAVGAVSNSGSLNNTGTVLPTLPSQFTNGAPTNSYVVANGQTTPLNLGNVTFQFDGKIISGAILSSNKPYKVTLAAIRYYTSAGGYATSTFMNGLSNWTTGTVNP